MSRREYNVSLRINGRTIVKVIIDPHYEEKHMNALNDEIVLKLVRTLHYSEFEADAVQGLFSYFVNDWIQYNGRAYKLVWLLEDHQIYVGVVNAYRR